MNDIKHEVFFFKKLPGFTNLLVGFSILLQYSPDHSSCTDVLLGCNIESETTSNVPISYFGFLEITMKIYLRVDSLHFRKDIWWRLHITAFTQLSKSELVVKGTNHIYYCEIYHFGKSTLFKGYGVVP